MTIYHSNGNPKFKIDDELILMLGGLILAVIGFIIYRVT